MDEQKVSRAVGRGCGWLAVILGALLAVAAVVAALRLIAWLLAL